MEIDDEEVNCVFCGKLFSSIEKIQEHISQFHENNTNNTNEQNIGGNQDVNGNKMNIINKQLKVYDSNTELITNRPIDYNNIVQCLKCGLNFVNSYASRMHYDKVHAVKKRRRTNNNSSNNSEMPLSNANINDLKYRDILPNAATKSNAKESNTNMSVPKLEKIVNENHNTADNNDNNNDDDDDDDDAYDEYYEEVENCQNNNDDDDDDMNTVNMTNSENSTSTAIKDANNKMNGGDSISPVQQNRYGYTNKKGRQCPHCANIFLNRESYRRHMLMHGKQHKNYCCIKCGSRFERIKDLKKHRSQNCNAANSNINDNSNLPLKQLQPITKAAKITPRPPLDHSTPNNSSVVNTNKSVSVTNETLNPRDVKFAEKFLSNSAIILNKGSQCVCNLCQSCFYSNQSVLKHLITYHRICVQDGSTPLTPTTTTTPTTKQTPSTIAPPPPTSTKPPLHFIHSCQHCGSQFASHKGLQRHLITAHNDIPSSDDPNNLENSICTECGVESWQTHKPECCNINKTNSTTKSNPTTTTTTTTTNPQRVKCDLCKKRFRNPNSLSEHRRIHHSDFYQQNNEMKKIKLEQKIQPKMIQNTTTTVTTTSTPTPTPYTLPNSYKKAKVPPNADGLFECDVCHKAFTCRSSLSNHVKSHFNFKNKPFSCSACQQGFMSTLSLQHHREKLCPNLVHNDSTNDNEENNDNTDMSVDFNSAPNTTGGATDNSMYSSFDGVSQVPFSDSFGNSMNSSFTTRATSCMHCPAVFSDRSLLEDHASKEHSNNAGEVVCIICPRSFTTYMAFRVHMTKSHGGPNGTSLKSALNAAAAAAAAVNGNGGSNSTSQHSPHKSPNSSSSFNNPPPLHPHNLNHYNNSSPNSSLTNPTSNFHNNTNYENLDRPVSPSPPTLIKKEALVGPNYRIPSVNTNPATNNSRITTTHTTTVAAVPVIGSTGRIYTNRHGCPNCDKDFSTSQALGNHKRACMPNLYKKHRLNDY